MIHELKNIYICLCCDKPLTSGFQCLNCGYVLSSEDGSSIDDNEEVVEWIKKNCEQPEKK